MQPINLSSPAYHELLDRQRLSHGLSFNQLAERAWTTPSYVFRLCRGTSRPSYRLVLRLAIAMGLTLEETDEMLRLAGCPTLLKVRALDSGERGADADRAADRTGGPASLD